MPCFEFFLARVESNVPGMVSIYIELQKYVLKEQVQYELAERMRHMEQSLPVRSRQPACYFSPYFRRQLDAKIVGMCSRAGAVQRRKCQQRR
jgi:hypothetical protein